VDALILWLVIGYFAGALTVWLVVTAIARATEAPDAAYALDWHPDTAPPAAAVAALDELLSTDGHHDDTGRLVDRHGVVNGRFRKGSGSTPSPKHRTG
jgi:hypothetical protein